MDKITPFLFEGETTIRVVEQEDGQLWVVGKDVAAALGYKDTAKAVTTHCKHGRPIGVGDSPTPSRIDPQTVIIPEGDMYRLVIKSNLPSAERFEAWVMDQLLPSIRKTGQYQAPPHIDDMGDQTPDSLKLRKVNTAVKCFGERAGAQLWTKLGLDWVPAMAAMVSQDDLFDSATPPGVTITVAPNLSAGRHNG